MDLTSLRLAKHKILELKIKNVQAVGIGYQTIKGKPTKQLGILVYVDVKKPLRLLSIKELIPPIVKIDSEYVITDVVQSGIIKSSELIDRIRPVKPGYSISHKDVTAGTFGCIVKKKKPVDYPGEFTHFILSNKHVLAPDGCEIGDEIVQPGTHDGGKLPTDIIGKLDSYVPIELTLSECAFSHIVAKAFNLLAKIFHRHSRLEVIRSGSNLVDRALASCFTCTDDIENIGKPQGIVEGELGMSVCKCGRTTEYTEGKITAIEATVNVWYGKGFAQFEDQLISDIECAGGDSGSVILDKGTNLVGLLFAGGEGNTIMNRIQNVFEAEPQLEL